MPPALFGRQSRIEASIVILKKDRHSPFLPLHQVNKASGSAILQCMLYHYTTELSMTQLTNNYLILH
jgi:hypothetical protein